MEEAKQILKSYLEYPEMDNIELMKKAIKTVLSELEKKDKVINEMVHTIWNYDICDYEITDDTYRKCEYIADDEEPPCKECIKEYFTNKVEREGK